MIRLTLVLGGLIWAVMALAPELESPVFTEMVAAVEPVVEPTPEVSRSVATPVAIAAPVSAPEPAVEVALATPESAPVVVESAPENTVWYVTGTRVNVREGPSTNYAVLGKVVYGDAFLLVSDPDSDWIKIRIEGDGVEGYIAKRLTARQDPLR